MGSHVLVAFDDSEPAQRALEHAIENFPETDITVLTVIGEVGSVNDSEDVCWEDDDGAFAELAEERLTLAEDIADAHGVSIRTECVVGPPCEKILEYAEATDVDHIVMGSRSRTGLLRLIVGSVSENVAREVSPPVTTVQ